MIAKRIYNNNVVLASKENGEEIILVGRGLAFGLVRGDRIFEDRIEKTFELKDEVDFKFKELIKDIHVDYILVAEEIISYIKSESNKELNDSIYVSLTDHIANMVDRIQKGMSFDSLLLLNVKMLYKEEYSLALKALDILRQKLNMKIGQEEANFIALHIVNSETDSNLMQLYSIISMIDEIMAVIDRYYHFENKDSLSYDRFITHCRFFVQRIVNKEYLEETPPKNSPVFELMKKNYPRQSECIEDISSFIQKKYKYTVSNDERLYLLIHLSKLST